MEKPHTIDLSHPEFDSHEFLHHDVLPGLNRDMRFVGVFYIIYGAFACLSIVGAIIGIPIIIMGLRLRDTARGLEVYDLHHNQKALHFALIKQRSFYAIQKIILIVLIIFMLLWVMGIFFMLSSGLLNNMFTDDDVEVMRNLPVMLG